MVLELIGRFAVEKEGEACYHLNYGTPYGAHDAYLLA